MSADTGAGMDISVTVNGESETLPPGTTLAAVITKLCDARGGIAAAVGDSVVPRGQWDTLLLNDGDEVEILTAVQGG